MFRKRTTRTRNGKRETILSKRFYGTIRTADGKRKQVPLTEDVKTSRKLLSRLQTEADNDRANGITSRHRERLRPIDDVVNEYMSFLASKGNTDYHVERTGNRIRTLLTATKTKTLADVDANRITTTLAAWRKRKRKPINVTTSNHWLVAVKGFTRWAWRQGKTSDDPLAGLSKMNAETDRRRVRRPLTPTEFATLTEATQASGKRYLGSDWQFTATDRVMLYEIAAFTGLRASEIATLTKASFDFEAGTWTLDASAAKNRKATTLPLSKSLSVKLRSWFETLSRDVLFPGSWAKKAMGGRFFKRDAKRAGIATVDASGRCVDFHALRTTFVTSLAKAGVHPAKAQRLARHSTITLTMNVYTSLDVDDLRDAVDAIR